MPKKSPKNMQRTMVYLRPDQVTGLQQLFQEQGMRPAGKRFVALWICSYKPATYYRWKRRRRNRAKGESEHGRETWTWQGVRTQRRHLVDSVFSEWCEAPRIIGRRPGRGGKECCAAD